MRYPATTFSRSPLYYVELAQQSLSTTRDCHDVRRYRSCARAFWPTVALVAVRMVATTNGGIPTLGRASSVTDDSTVRGIALVV